jgi:hypothetical protein
MVCTLALSTMIGFGCSPDDAMSPSEPRASAPELPPAWTMAIDLDFPAEERANPSADEIRSGRPGPALLAATADHHNWINAYVRAAFVLLLTYDHLEEPVAAFALAAHSVPQSQDDGSYLWTYIFVDQKTGVEYSIFLFGTPGDAAVAWRMEISSNDPAQPLDHFVWFDGESANDERSGYWQFYAPSGTSEGTQTARIDWQNAHADRHLTIAVNGEGLENEGDELEFRHAGGVSTIDYTDASAATTSNITWRADGSGSLTVPDYNGGETACWDTHQRDAACE